MRHGLAAIPALAAMVLAFAACGDDGLGLGPVQLSTDTVTLAAPTSASGMGTAVDLLSGNAVRFPERLSDAGEWDLALRQSGAAFSLLPFRTLTGGTTVQAAAFRSDDPITRIEFAPTGQSRYTLTTLFPIAEGQVYVARSRLGQGPFNTPCIRYSKFQVLDLDAAAGTAKFEFITNLDCNDDRLTPDD